MSVGKYRYAFLHSVENPLLHFISPRSFVFYHTEISQTAANEFPLIPPSFALGANQSCEKERREKSRSVSVGDDHTVSMRWVSVFSKLEHSFLSMIPKQLSVF